MKWALTGKTRTKLALSFTAFLLANIWLIFKGASKGAAEFFISPAVEETIVFVLLQMAVIAVYFIRPLTVKKFRAVYWGVSEFFVLTTFLFWGIIIVGPIWTWG